MKKVNGRRWVRLRRWLARRRKKMQQLWGMIERLERHNKQFARFLKAAGKKE